MTQKNRYLNPCTLGLHETSIESTTNGCIPANVGIKKTVGYRHFRLARFNAAFSVGKLYGASTAATETSAEIIGNASDVGFLAGVAAAATVAVLTDATALGTTAIDDYANGFIFITNGAGEGQVLHIKSNTADTTNAVTFTLYDAVTTALTTASDCIIMKDPYRIPVICDAGSDSVGYTLGVPTVPSTVGTTPDSSHDIYAWVQTWGPCAVYTEDTGALGDALIHSDGGSHDGGVAAGDETADGFVGIRMTVATAAADFCAVFLMISR